MMFELSNARDIAELSVAFSCEQLNSAPRNVTGHWPDFPTSRSLQPQAIHFSSYSSDSTNFSVGGRLLTSCFSPRAPRSFAVSVLVFGLDSTFHISFSASCSVPPPGRSLARLLLRSAPRPALD